MSCMIAFVVNNTEAKALRISKCTWESLCKSFLSIKACKENKRDEYDKMIKAILESTEGCDEKSDNDSEGEAIFSRSTILSVSTFENNYELKLAMV
eukprot:2975698-Rhodomonas_salina.1